MRRTQHPRLVFSSKSSLRSCCLPLARKTSSHASRTPCSRTASQESSQQTRMTRQRHVSRSTSLPPSEWVCSQRVCASGSRTRRPSRNHSQSQRATARIHAVYRAIRRTHRAAGPGAGAVLRRGDETTPGLPQEGGRTHAAQRPIASASLQAKLARALTQTRARARQPLLKSAATHPAARHPAHYHALVRRHPNAAGAVPQYRYHEARHPRDELGVLLQA